MARQKNRTSKQLETLIARVGRWRADREGTRTRVPEELWKAAVEVARVDGVSATSRATGFGYPDLKSRVSLAMTVAASETWTPAFIEVAMPRVTTHEALSKTVVELEGRGGGRLRVEVTGMSGVDVVGLAHAFWSRER